MHPIRLSGVMWKTADEISPTVKLFNYFLIFYVFLLLKRYFFIQQSTSIFLTSLRSVLRVLHMRISIMQWGIPVGVHTFRKAPFLRAKFVFGSYSFYPIFLFVLYFADVRRFLFKYT